MTDGSQLALDYDVADGQSAPPLAEMQHWAASAIEQTALPCELSIRVVNDTEGRALNRQWRNRDTATNVLSFPGPDAGNLPFRHLGDVVICAPVVAREAAQQGKSERAHWAHLVVHGILHLLGHDHQNDRDASRMEQAETEILRGLGFPDPYL